jgi:hypothetical protein
VDILALNPIIRRERDQCVCVCVRERERERVHESRTRKETRSGPRIWARNETEKKLFLVLQDFHGLNFE